MMWIGSMMWKYMRANKWGKWKTSSMSFQSMRNKSSLHYYPLILLTRACHDFAGEPSTVWHTAVYFPFLLLPRVSWFLRGSRVAASGSARGLITGAPSHAEVKGHGKRKRFIAAAEGQMLFKRSLRREMIRHGMQRIGQVRLQRTTCHCVMTYYIIRRRA